MLTIAEIKRRNHEAGKYFFSPDTMGFFASRVFPQVYDCRDGSAYFVTSEKRGFDDHNRSFTVRVFSPSGEVSTARQFNEFKSKPAALDAAKQAARDHDNAQARESLESRL